MPTLTELLQGVNQPDSAQAPAEQPPQEQPTLSQLLSKVTPPAEAPPQRGIDVFVQQTMKPAAEFFEGTIQHASALLSKLGLVPPNVAEGIKKVREEHNEKLDEATKKAEDEFPLSAGAGNVAGQILLYGAGNPAFFESRLGMAAAESWPMMARLLGAGAQGAVLEGLKARKPEDIGEEAFMGALGAMGGQAVGEVAGRGVMWGMNAAKAGSLARWMKQASDAWTQDGMGLASRFQLKLQETNRRGLQLITDAESRMRNEIQLNGGKPPAEWGRTTQAAIDKAQQWRDDNEFLTSEIFTKVKKAADEAGGKGKTTWVDANKQILKIATGDDNIKAQKLYNALSTQDRNLVQKGILYDALERATVKGTTKYNPEKLKEVLSEPGAKVFFNKAFRGKEVVEGFTNIVGEAMDFLGHHPYLLAHGMSAAAGMALGYERGGVEGAAEGFTAYLAMVLVAQKGMNSQYGRNLMAAAAHATPGTPAMAKYFGAAMQMIGAPLGTMATVQPNPLRDGE